MRNVKMNLSKDDAALLGLDPAGAFAQRAPPSALLEVRLALATVTPVLGGGVDPFRPADPSGDDDPDPVRVPAIRGHLRQWARWTSWPLEATGAQLEKRREDEARLWGGVLGPRDVHRSRVRLTVENVQAGTIVPAGVHRMGGSGPKAVAEWENVARGLGYALFPLQAPDADRKGKREPVPTLPVRRGLRFELVLTLLPGKSEHRDRETEQITEVLRALWAWIHLGGIGARTRRGFGALRLERAPQLDAASWSAADFCPSDAQEWHAALKKACGPSSRMARSTVLVQERRQDSSEQVHGALVGLLRNYRQGAGQGRAREGGKSLWPEAALLRWKRISQEQSPIHGEVLAGRVGVPRAAFGLPLEINFKDQVDRQANASVRPPGRERMASPLLIRPLVLGREALPMADFLASEPAGRLDHVEVHFKEGAERAAWQVPLRASGGAHRPVSDQLRASGGDALAAFQSWLDRDHQFKVWRTS